jgi:hypothetical protein
MGDTSGVHPWPETGKMVTVLLPGGGLIEPGWTVDLLATPAGLEPATNSLEG